MYKISKSILNFTQGNICEEKGITDNTMFGWHHRLDGHVFE